MDKLTKALGYLFKNHALLREALTHKSAGTPHNERFEFLGDSVLNLVITDALLKQYPELPEGTLSPIRAQLVMGSTLATLAKEIELGEALHLGQGELKSGGHERASILADAFEALLGAIYLDSDFKTVQRIVLSLYKTLLFEAKPTKDAKTALQEYLQAQKSPPASYEVTQVRGKQHDQVFSVTCTVGKHVEHGEGKTRKAAEQMAAEKMLALIK